MGVIRDAEIDPGPGLTVITGETGAGKTLLLGALRLLLGEAADSAVVGPFGDAAQADGVLLGEEEIGVSRIVPTEGRSRSYIDGAIASAEALGRRVGAFIEIVGQHDQLELRRRSHVLTLIDGSLDKQGQTKLKAYQAAWDGLLKKLEDERQIGGSGSELARELDLVRHQHREISTAGFEVGDEVDLQEKETRLRNAAEIKEHLEFAVRAAAAIDESAGELVSRMRKIGELDPSAAGLVESAESVSITASELTRDLNDSVEGLVEDPAELAAIEDRLTLLGDLKRKYGKTIDQILEFGSKAGDRARELEGLLTRASSIETELEHARQKVAEAAAELSEARKGASERLAEQIVDHLSEVGLDGATVEFGFEQVDPGSSGADRVEIRFASHGGLQPGPLGKVASGGELSRLILAISLATTASTTTTMVFDEVDAGVGGATALAMGRKLADLAHSRQVLCVTHLPQVAAFADVHYVIRRSGEEASIERLAGPARLEELSRMIAGLPESERGQQAASELLELSGM